MFEFYKEKEDGLAAKAKTEQAKADRAEYGLPESASKLALEQRRNPELPQLVPYLCESQQETAERARRSVGAHFA